MRDWTETLEAVARAELVQRHAICGRPNCGQCARLVAQRAEELAADPPSAADLGAGEPEMRGDR